MGKVIAQVMVYLAVAVRLKALPDVGFCLLQRPHINLHHLNRGLGVALLGLMAGEVPHESADAKTDNALALDPLNEEPVDV